MLKLDMDKKDIESPSFSKVAKIVAHVPLILIWGFFALVIGLFLITSERWSLRTYIDKPVETVSGTVVRTDRNDHCHVWYTYLANGKTYHGLDSGDWTKSPGDPIPVYFPSADPSTSRLANPKNAKQEVLVSGVLGGAYLALVPTLWVYVTCKRRLALDRLPKVDGSVN